MNRKKKKVDQNVKKEEKYRAESDFIGRIFYFVAAILRLGEEDSRDFFFFFFIDANGNVFENAETKSVIIIYFAGVRYF